MVRHHYISSTIALIIYFISPVQGQISGLKFEQLASEQQLSQSTVNAIVQDKLGFMWFGTQDGLNRFDGYSITVFRHNPSDTNSLSDNNIWSMLCDSKGDLWIGTERGGLNRYVTKENRFYHYTYKDYDSSSISENFITSIFEDSNGNIWIGTPHRGLNCFNPLNGTFKRFLFDEKSISYSNYISSICEDNNKTIWVATRQGLYNFALDKSNSYSGGLNFKHYSHIPSDPNSLSNNDIRTLFYDREGMLWIGTWGAGFNRFDGKLNAFIRYKDDSKKSKSISGNFINSIYEDSKGSLWIGTFDGGLNLYDIKFNSSKYINENVLTLFEDQSGIIWIGTFAGGVKVYDRKKNKFRNSYDYPFPNSYDLHNNLVFAILLDGDDELWVGTWDNGIYRFNRQTMKITNYSFDKKNKYSLISNQVYALCESSEGSIWVGTPTGGLDRFNKKTNKFTHYKHDPKNPNSIRFNGISALNYDEQANVLWIGYSNGGISSYHILKNVFQHFIPDVKDPTSISGSLVTSIYRGKRSGLWVSTLQGGANHFIPETGSFKRYQVQNVVSSSIKSTRRSDKYLNNNGIFKIHEDEEGIIWLGTYGGGLNRYDPFSGTFTYYTMDDGLPNNIIYGILPDKNGNLWLSTNMGLSQFNPKTKTFRNFDMNDGLLSNEFNWAAYYASPHGELFFGGIKGFNAFYPEEVATNKYVPPIYFSSFKVFDKVLPLSNSTYSTKQIELSYSQNFFSFEFVALNYTSSEKNQYAYKLEGFDKDWHTVSAQHRYASYTNLDPGEYVLHVKGSNNDGIWNDAGTSIKILIIPPFWMRWWFKSFIVLLIISAVLTAYYRRERTLRQEKDLQQQISRSLIKTQEEERKRIAQEMHDSLGQDLLFIKNRLILTIQDVTDNPATQENLNQISTDVSGVLKTVREISHNLRPPDLDRLGLTETLQSILISFRKSTSLKVTGEVGNINGLIPSELEINLVRILQESLGNIIKHSESTECRILIIRQNGCIHFEVNDNGKGFEQENVLKGVTHNAGLGLVGIIERVKILGGQFEIFSTIGKGTRIEISIPLNNEIEELSF